MKTRIRLIEVLLVILNLVGLIWISAYSQDNEFREIILAETESTLRKGVPENNHESGLQQTEENLRKIEQGQYRYAAALQMQIDVANSYAHSYKRYRTASYFAAVIFVCNLFFVLCTAAVLENLFDRVLCKESADS